MAPSTTLASVLLASAALAQPAPVVEPAPAWNDLFRRTDGWTGADGAAGIPLPGARYLWLFGDSWIGPVTDNRHAAGSAMVNNTIAVHDAPDLAAPPADLAFLWNQAGPKPAAWAIPTQPDQWFWPAGGGIVVAGADGTDRLLVFMTRLARRDKSDSVWNFACRGTTLLTIHNPAAPPASWNVTQSTLTALDPPAELTWGTAVLPDPDDAAFLLVYGIDAAKSLDKKALLARARIDSTDRFDTWHFRTANGWDPSPAAAVPVASNVVSEVSIHSLDVPGSPAPRYLMILTEPPLGPRILARSAPRPEGPWSDPVPIYTCPEPAADPRNMVYSAKAHPHLSAPGELLVSYSVNSTDFWHMAAHADLYLPRFIRVPASLLPEPP